MQMQGYAVVAAAGAQGEDLIGEVVRAGWMKNWETVHLVLGADADRTARFFACGMLGNALTAIGLPQARESSQEDRCLPEGRGVSARLPHPAG
ncbi:hypothetical protein [Streptomyces sp. ME18-1-4]|uniref:hypothetical protein n=1 Tax=Streptomyces sp. ME18-1-4 TaxID=3028685 RepID=UPI0029B6C8AB|nr:hypothetical protein [Streptomyces sp. ME18-1-4]MDX3242089.1 hypothetical protein [Streptomyces sp. ME18-1-4]